MVFSIHDAMANAKALLQKYGFVAGDPVFIAVGSQDSIEEAYGLLGISKDERYASFVSEFYFMVFPESLNGTQITGGQTILKDTGYEPEAHVLMTANGALSLSIFDHYVIDANNFESKPLLSFYDVMDRHRSQIKNMISHFSELTGEVRYAPRKNDDGTYTMTPVWCVVEEHGWVVLMDYAIDL